MKAGLFLLKIPHIKSPNDAGLAIFYHHKTVINLRVKSASFKIPPESFPLIFEHLVCLYICCSNCVCVGVCVFSVVAVMSTEG